MTIDVIGLGVAEKAKFSEAAEQALFCADLVIGSSRQLKVIEAQLKPQQETKELPKLSELSALIDQKPEKNIVVLASGDPLYFGIGRWFLKHYDVDQVHFHPAVSSIQAACHLVGVALQDTEVFSLHGRPLEKLRTTLRKNQYFVVLTDKKSKPAMLAQECLSAGFGQSVFWVCENMGYANQRVRKLSVEQLLKDKLLEFDPLHVTVIQTLGTGGVLPEFPGIPDARFVTGDKGEVGKGLITKREVRLAILSLIQPSNDDIIWDIGAGCGGVSVELAYWNERVQVFGIEHNTDRFSYLDANREHFGVVSNLTLVEGKAPDVLSELPVANKVFIGGSGGELENLLFLVWKQLPENGVLVASAVTESSKQKLLAFSDQIETLEEGDSETLQIAVSKGSRLAGQLLYRPSLPVSLFRFQKTVVRTMLAGGRL